MKVWHPIQLQYDNCFIFIYALYFFFYVVTYVTDMIRNQ